MHPDDMKPIEPTAHRFFCGLFVSIALVALLGMTAFTFWKRYKAEPQPVYHLNKIYEHSHTIR